MSYEGVAYKHFSSWIEKSSTLPGGVTAHAVTQTERRLFLLLLSLEESNQRTCEILTHDALSTPRAESFGGVNDEQCHRVLHAHRNFTPSSASALRTPPKISRCAGSCCSACWCRGMVHDTPGTSSLIIRCLVFDILARGVTAYANCPAP
jgi:hypothetical protein